MIHSGAIWQEKGEKDMARRIQKRLADIPDHHKIPDLPETVCKAMAHIREAGVRELTAGVQKRPL